MTSERDGRLALIGVPYHLGQRGVSMGRGPQVLLADELAPARLRALGADVDVQMVDADDPNEEQDQALIFGDQMSRHLVQDRATGELVRAARAAGRTPIVSCGNCNTSLGVLGGLDEDGLGVVWLDAHADSETPDTSLSGLFDGMPLSTIAGKCWPQWRRQIPGFREVPEERIVFVGNHADREVGPMGTAIQPPQMAERGLEAALADALATLATRTSRVYLHIDVDVVDEQEGKASNYTAPGGLAVAQVARAIEQVHEHVTVLATSFSAYDPDVDPRMRDIVLGLMEVAARAVLRQGGAQVERGAGPVPGG